MIYFTAGDVRVIVIEPGNIARLKDGQPLRSPDGTVFLFYTPDIEWLSAALQGRGLIEGRELDVDTFNALLREGLSRPEVHRDNDTMRKVL